jgi:hypothetical protein
VVDIKRYIFKPIKFVQPVRLELTYSNGYWPPMVMIQV